MKVGYARVSSRQQADTDALNQQVDRLKKAGAEQILFDVQSGRDNFRSRYKELLSLVKSGVATEVLTTRLDRLGRSVIEIHRAIELFKKHGVKYTNLDMPLDGSGSPTEWFTIQTISALAELESRCIADRTKHGLNYFRQNLKYFSTPPFGYAKNENSQLIPHPTNWAIAKQICFKLRSQSKGSITRWLMDEYGISFYPTHFRRYIQNPALRGHTAYQIDGKKEIHYDTHAPLISESEYNELVETCGLKTRYEATNKNKVHFLAGLVQCGICGGSLSRFGITKTHPSTTRFQCSRYKRLGTKACSNRKSISFSVMKQATIEHLISYAQQITNEIQMQTSLTPDDEELNEMQRQLEALKKIGENPAPVIQSAIADLEAQVKTRQLTQNARHSQGEEDEQILQALLQPDFWQTLSDEELRTVCIRFLKSVSFIGGEKLTFSMRLASV